MVKTKDRRPSSTPFRPENHRNPPHFRLRPTLPKHIKATPSTSRKPQLPATPPGPDETPMSILVIADQKLLIKTERSQSAPRIHIAIDGSMFGHESGACTCVLEVTISICAAVGGTRRPRSCRRHPSATQVIPIQRRAQNRDDALSRVQGGVGKGRGRGGMPPISAQDRDRPRVCVPCEPVSGKDGADVIGRVTGREMEGSGDGSGVCVWVL